MRGRGTEIRVGDGERGRSRQIKADSSTGWNNLPSERQLKRKQMKAEPDKRRRLIDRQLRKKEKAKKKRAKGTLRCMDSYLRCICASRPLTRPWNDRACLLPAAQTKVYFKEIRAGSEEVKLLRSYLGSWVKAWKPAFEATNRRMAWKWLSSSAFRAGSSASWDKSARMALLMSFSLFSEKRPWREKKKRKQ